MFDRSILGFAVVAFLAAGCATNTQFQSAKVSPEGGERTTTVNGRFAKPDGDGPFPAVVLLPTCAGLLPHVTHDWPEFLTANGYAVMTVESFRPPGLKFCPGVPQDKRIAIQAGDAYAALEHLAGLPDVDGSRIAVMGFWNGGTAINAAITQGKIERPGNRDFKAAIELYGDCDRLLTYDRDRMPLLAFVAGRDPGNNKSCREKLARYQGIESYVADAKLGFDSKNLHHWYVTGDSSSGLARFSFEYDDWETKRAREMVRAFLAKHLGR